jgi:hypothetical protein
MSGSADVFRQRASHLLRIGGGEKDPNKQRVCRTLADSYEALARNEEWLEGECAPCPDTPSGSPVAPRMRDKPTVSVMA